MALVQEVLAGYHMARDLEVIMEYDLSQIQVLMMEYDWVPEQIEKWGKYKYTF